MLVNTESPELIELRRANLLLEELLRKSQVAEFQLWGLDEIALYTNYEKSSVKTHIITCKDFPKPYTANGQAGKRYKPSEIMAWYERHSPPK